jgi:hypothetical protein
MSRFLSRVLLGAAVVGGGWAAPVSAAVTRAVINEDYASYVTEDLGAAVTPFGTEETRWDPTTRTLDFFITSEPGDPVISHSGQGVRVGTDDEELAFSDVVFDTTTLRIDGELSAAFDLLGVEMAFPLPIETADAFAVAPLAEVADTYEINLTAEAADLLNTVLGAGDTFSSGDIAATVTTGVVETPLPAALPLLAVGVGGLALTAAATRRRAAT